MSKNLPAVTKNKVVVFGAKPIRRAWVDNQWYFSVIDIVGVLTDSASPPKYWDAMKRREKASSGVDLSTFCRKVPLSGADGKIYRSEAVSTEAAFRIIQSIPSPKAEPFKRWLARVGKERIDEIENPELAMARMQEIYEKKGYPKDWIDKRMRGIAVRQDLTDEWQNRGARSKLEYAILTNEIMQGTFGLKVEEYKQVKDLERENLRDHMTDLELILTMLAEATTTKLHRDRDSQGLPPLMKDAHDGGAVAGRTRKDIETQTGKPVISKENFKALGGKIRKRLSSGEE